MRIKFALNTNGLCEGICNIWNGIFRAVIPWCDKLFNANENKQQRLTQIGWVHALNVVLIDVDWMKWLWQQILMKWWLCHWFIIWSWRFIAQNCRPSNTFSIYMELITNRLINGMKVFVSNENRTEVRNWMASFGRNGIMWASQLKTTVIKYSCQHFYFNAFCFPLK